MIQAGITVLLSSVYASSQMPLRDCLRSRSIPIRNRQQNRLPVTSCRSGTMPRARSSSCKANKALKHDGSENRCKVKGVGISSWWRTMVRVTHRRTFQSIINPPGGWMSKNIWQKATGVPQFQRLPLDYINQPRFLLKRSACHGNGQQP
jgi:hypothetical protein